MNRLSVAYLAGLFLLAFTGYTYFFHLSEQVSLSGYSAIETMVHLLSPENFARDFPNGNVTGTSHALITRLYAPIHQLTGLSGLAILNGMIGLEIACVIGAAWVLWTTMIRNVPSAGHRLGLFCWLATIMVAGYVIRPNLSNFGYPFFHGQFYGFADAVALLAIAAMLRARWMLVAGLLCIGFMIHPTKTLMTAVFIGGATLAGGRETINVRSIGAGLVAALFAGLWAYFWLGLGNSAGMPAIPDDLYIAYTRGWQYHWYPFDRGLLSFVQYDGLSPFLGMQLLGLLAMLKSNFPRNVCKHLLGGLVILGVLTLIGLWFSYSLTSVFMIKLALHRASELMTLLVPFIVMGAIYHQWQQKHWGWVAFFTGFLLAGMVTTSALSAVVAALGVCAYIFSERKIRKLTLVDKALVALAGIIFIGALVLGIQYPEAGKIWKPVVMCLIPVLAVWIALQVAKRSPWQPALLAWGAISAGFILTSGYYIHHLYRMDDATIAQARDYRDVQLWAKDNTKQDALFMVDPCQAYGWREFSERSSVGTAFEWFHTGWLYVSDNRVFERGQAIRKTLDIDFDGILPRPGARAEFINYPVCEMAQARFYDPGLKPQKRMVRDQGVDYFVMETGRSDALMAARHLKPVFANSHYRVFVAKEFQP